MMVIHIGSNCNTAKFNKFLFHLNAKCIHDSNIKPSTLNREPSESQTNALPLMLIDSNAALFRIHVENGTDAKHFA